MTGDLDTTGVRAEAARAQDLRRQLESGIAPSATSIDGRSFSFQAPLGMALQPGGYVTLRHGDTEALGQVLAYRLERREGPEISGAVPDGSGGAYRARLTFGVGAGTGVVLDGDGPFHEAEVAPAAPERVGALLAARRPVRAHLAAGALSLASGVPAELDAGGFARHTFLCGQSGSGKSYAMGLLVEQLLVQTDLPVVVLDPNSDCTRLREPRAGADPVAAAAWQRVVPRILVRSAGAAGDDRLRLRLFDLPPALQAAVAGLDPLRDREEYGAMLTVVEREGQGDTLDDLAALLAVDEPGMRALALRLRNLGLGDWELWSRDRTDPGLLADLDREDWRCLVVDLGSVVSPQERSLVSAAVLEHLWARRAGRRPVLVVIDEAHNVCPAEPTTPLVALATEAVVRIAAEGRKFGLHLLVATQRPQKVQENVLSQCDNLILMRMNSTGDLAHLSGLFSFTPPTLMERATSLRLGEALVAGKLAPHPLLMRFGARVAEEGGADVPATWAAARPPT